jgi:heat shock protein HtpX
MIGALRSLQHNRNLQELPGNMAAFGIAGGLSEGISRLFMSHPPLGERIAALEHMDPASLRVTHGH